jgi:hypothetical protein
MTYDDAAIIYDRHMAAIFRNAADFYLLSWEEILGYQTTDRVSDTRARTSCEAVRLAAGMVTRSAKPHEFAGRLFSAQGDWVLITPQQDRQNIRYMYLHLVALMLFDGAI